MPTFRATTSSGAVTEYDAALPQSEHLGEGWQLEELIVDAGGKPVKKTGKLVPDGKGGFTVESQETEAKGKGDK